MPQGCKLVFYFEKFESYCNLVVPDIIYSEDGCLKDRGIAEELTINKTGEAGEIDEGIKKITEIPDVIGEEIALTGDEISSAEVKYKDDYMEVWEIRTKQFNLVLIFVIIIVGSTLLLYEIFNCKEILTNEFGEPIIVNGDLVGDYTKAKNFLFYIELFFLLVCGKEIID